MSSLDSAAILNDKIAFQIVLYGCAMVPLQSTEHEEIELMNIRVAWIVSEIKYTAIIRTMEFIFG